MLELTVRLVVSLAMVVGLLLLVVRVGGRRFRSNAQAPVRVLHRQALTRSSGVAVREVGGRVLLVGTTEHQVSMLTELDPEAFATEAEPAVATTEPAPEVFTPSSFADHVEHAVRELGTDAADADDSPATDRAPAPVPRVRAPQPRPADDRGALSGSVLSADTWRQAVAAARGRS